GIFYETPNYYQLTAFANTQPYSIQQTVNSPASFSNPYAGLVDPFPYHPPITAAERQAFQFLLPVTIGESIDQNLVGGYMQQWNFNVQHETVENIVLTAGYVGSKGTHLPLQVESNPAIYAAGATLANVNARRVYGTDFASIANYASIGDSTYHALQLSLNKRFSRGFTVLASYTYAKSIDNGSTDTLGGWQDPRNLTAEKAVSDFDVPQRFVGSFLWALPAPGARAAKAILGGWQWNGIVTLQSGTPVKIVSGQDRYLAGTGSQRPNLVGDPAVANPGIAEWFNPAAFALPALGTYGNLGRNILFGPGSKNVDLSLFREFKIVERFRLQLRAEAFNSLNHPNFTNPVATSTSANAGRILSAADPRILQFALRLRF
ncbi:MAG: carboxypeptidase regulatory-like domain-containing protein, partial [Bryobacteraceae bacterium]